MSRRYRLPRFNDQLLSEIVFGIENQDVDYMLDIGTGNLYSSDVDGAGPSSEENLVELPPWTSTDGYQLMVSFTNSCRNQQLKDRLAGELNSKSKGVFRRFRDVLSENPDDLLSTVENVISMVQSVIEDFGEKPAPEQEALTEPLQEETEEMEVSDTLDTILELIETGLNVADYYLTDEAKRPPLEELFARPTKAEYLPTRGLENITLEKQ